MRRFVVGIALLALIASGCGGGGGGDSTGAQEPDTNAPQETMSIPTVLIASDFEQVCGGGTIAGAAEYSKSPGIHPLLAFEGEDPEYEYTSLSLPEGWESDLEVEKTELVLCLNIVEEKKVRTCKNYESDDRPEPFDVEVYNATYEVTLYAASSGEEVASGKISTNDKECPFLVFFDEEEDVQREYADASDLVRGFVKQYVSR